MVIQTDTDGQITAVNLIRYNSCTKTTFGGLAYTMLISFVEIIGNTGAARVRFFLKVDFVSNF
jgi:hypothetical protein